MDSSVSNFLAKLGLGGGRVFKERGRSNKARIHRDFYHHCCRVGASSPHPLPVHISLSTLLVLLLGAFFTIFFFIIQEIGACQKKNEQFSSEEIFQDNQKTLQKFSLFFFFCKTKNEKQVVSSDSIHIGNSYLPCYKCRKLVTESGNIFSFSQASV